jgi:hypothetical protein
MRIYPTEAAIPGWSFGGLYRFTKKLFFEEIMPVVLQLSTPIDEIDYAGRLSPGGHGMGLFAKRFTTMIACCPIWVAEPTDPLWSDLLFQGKHWGSCFKIQIGINWLGWTVLFTGLHVGTRVRRLTTKFGTVLLKPSLSCTGNIGCWGVQPTLLALMC